MDGFDNMEEYFDFISKNLHSIQPLTDEEIDMVHSIWRKTFDTLPGTEIEKKSIGMFEDKGHIVAHFTPLVDNDACAFYTLYRDEFFKRTGNAHYTVEYTPFFADLSYEAEKELDEQDEPKMLLVYRSNNLRSATEGMVDHWADLLRQR